MNTGTSVQFVTVAAVQQRQRQQQGYTEPAAAEAEAVVDVADRRETRA